MKCHWSELLNLLPFWLRDPVDKLGKEDMQELRLRIFSPPEVKTGHGSFWLERNVSMEDISYCLNMATRYSPWTSGSIKEGFLTAQGGHRIGICGECVYDGEKLKNINQVSSVCIRIAREYPDVSGTAFRNRDSVLIIGSPGSGKTTFLRDLICKTSNHYEGAVTVVDERRELFPCAGGKFLFERGKRTDILSGGRKTIGIEMAIRTMGPSVVAVDEITGQADCEALQKAARCGVRLFATAHAGNKEELSERKIYSSIMQEHIFDRLIVMRQDKTWYEEVL